MKNILVLGILTCDISMVGVNQLPAPGTALPVGHVTMQCGGTASNCAMDIAKLGIPVTLCGRIGSDSFSKIVDQTLEAYSPLLTNHVVHDPDPDANTTTSIICVHPDGERAIFSSLGATFHFNRKDIPKEDTDFADIVFISGALLLNSFEPDEEASFLKEMQEHRKFTCMDTCYDTEEIWLPKIKKAIPYLDLFMPSYNEAVKLTGETKLDKIADILFSFGSKNVLIKLGAKGAYLCEAQKERVLIPSFHYESCIDTTGAGDSFCAGFLCGLSNGYNLKEAVRLGNMVGATCITSIGGQAGIKTFSETVKLMNTCPVNQVSIDDLNQ